MEVARHRVIMDAQLRDQMGIEMRRLGFRVMKAVGPVTLEEGALASAPHGVPGLGPCDVVAPPALEYSGPGGASRLSDASLLTSVPVFPPQEVAASAAAVPPVLRRVCQEDALSDELRLRELCDGQCWVERRGYEHWRLHGRVFVP